MAVIASLLLMRLRPQAAQRARANLLDELKEGWAYVSGSMAIRSLLLLLALVSLVGMPYTVLMPIFAGSVLHGGAHTLGFLMAASGVGALAGALHLASRKTVLGLGRVVTVSAALFGAGLLGFSLSRQLWLSLVLMLVTGMGMMQRWRPATPSCRPSWKKKNAAG